MSEETENTETMLPRVPIRDLMQMNLQAQFETQAQLADIRDLVLVCYGITLILWVFGRG